MAEYNHNDNNDQDDNEIQLWKMRRIINSLNNLRGNGTSMISLVIPGGDLVCRYQAMLTNELGAASNIKSRVNRLSVIEAITSAQQKLKLYTKAPPNGLIIYTGNIVTDTGKEKKVSIDFEPFKPVSKYYKCDNVFHTEMLSSLLESDATYGFIIIDGHSTLFGTLNGTHKDTLYEYHVTLPHKHNKGGQSALRYARQTEEARHNYIRKVAELCINNFIDSSTNLPNVSGLVVGGSAEFKSVLVNSDLFDPRLKKIVIKLVDTSYGGNAGFNDAINQSSDALGHLKFIKEKKLMMEYMEEVAKMGKFCFGIADTMYALETGAISKLLVWDELDLVRYVLKNDDIEKIIYMNPEKFSKIHEQKYKEFTVVSEQIFIDWIAENYKKYGVNLYYVTNKSQEGNQFCQGFGGIGGIMRYSIKFENEYDIYDDDNDSDDFDNEESFI